MVLPTRIVVVQILTVVAHRVLLDSAKVQMADLDRLPWLLFIKVVLGRVLHGCIL